MKPADNLYHILGLAPDATQSEIRKAYQRLSMQHHPDRGGDNAKFAAINNAYQVLGDSARRAKYDDTGATEEADPLRLRAIDHLSRLFYKVLNENEVDYTDLVEVMREHIIDCTRQHEAQIAAANMAIVKCEKTIKRTKAKEGHILFDIQNNLINQHRQLIKTNEDGISLLEMMTTLIEDVNYNADEQPPMPRHVWHGFGPSSGGSGGLNIG